MRFTAKKNCNSDDPIYCSFSCYRHYERSYFPGYKTGESLSLVNRVKHVLTKVDS